MALLEAPGRGEPVEIERLPQPTMRLHVPMRDGIRLDTWIWLPKQSTAPAPAIMIRTPYEEHVLGWGRSGVLRYCDEGYAVVYQMIRGTGESQGEFLWNSRIEGDDGYDAVEWLAAQNWCSRSVAMWGSSYHAKTQLWAASRRPPHLRCIVPGSPTLGPFRRNGRVEPDCGIYAGGAFARAWMINWLRLISIASLAEMTGGFIDPMPILAKPEWLHRMTSRPVIDAADGLLKGDRLRHYREALSHPTFDDWWEARALQESDWKNIDVPAFVLSGSFDQALGHTLSAWRALEEHANPGVDRFLLVGAWDHGLVPADTYGPYELGEDAVIDIFALRLAFFNKYLKGERDSFDIGGRVKLFITGANEWRTFDAYPPREASIATLYLHSRGSANSARGDGELSLDKPVGDEWPDTLVSDPRLPFVPAFASADSDLILDVRELERYHETLVYSTKPLEIELTVVGQPQALLYVAADAPDCDLVVRLAEHRSDGRTIELAFGILRLRYREGFERELTMSPGVPVKVAIGLGHIAHRLPAGSRLQLLVGADRFPWIDPNPNTGEPIATETRMCVAVETLFHDVERSSCIQIPVFAL